MRKEIHNVIDIKERIVTRDRNEIMNSVAPDRKCKLNPVYQCYPHHRVRL